MPRVSSGMESTLLRYHPCQSGKGAEVPLVLFHGWGFDSRVWQPLLRYLTRYFNCYTVNLFTLDCFSDEALEATDQFDIPACIKQIETTLLPQLPHTAVFVGWSLGGMLASYLAQNYPQRCFKLITLASSFKWVADESWPGMPQKEFRQFQQRLQRKPEQIREHFLALQTVGDIHAEKITPRLVSYSRQAALSEHALQNGLCLLDFLDVREARFSMPALHLFGENDVLIQAKTRAAIAELQPDHQCKTFPNTGHAILLSIPALLAENILLFIQSDQYHLPKKAIADSFSLAAQSYDAAASLQVKVADHLLQKLPENQTPYPVLDLGSGTGYISQHLLKRYTQTVIAMDIAGKMLSASATNERLQKVNADAENLPLASRSISLVVSSLMLQWCSRPDQWMQAIYRVLQPGGAFLFSTFTCGTMHELHQAWQQVDNAVHTNHFLSPESLQECARITGFEISDTEQVTETSGFDSLPDLMRQLKQLGAHNINSGKSKGLTGKDRFKKICEFYEQHRNPEGKLSLTYQTFYMVLTKPLNTHSTP